ncbi:2-phospho-L-lactate guanylyltransferase [Schumannella luteola]|nr:2-phospho-L-lactate guanylyltransferase [Schumannella luteola]
MPNAERWSIVIPVKPAGIGKSRLGASPGLARAIALDSIEAVLRAPGVGRVVVVTADAELPAELAGIASEAAELVLVLEREPAGISAAITSGLTEAMSGPRAVLLGDVPALDPAELDAALAAAGQHPRSFVPDADGAGTVLVTAREGVPFVEAFGPGSAAAHRELGLAELPVDRESGLRRDVDTPEQLAEVVRRSPRSRTARVAAQPA